MKSANELKQWVDDEYAKVEGDPWGLEWRPSQKFRYLHTLQAIERFFKADSLRVSDIGCATGIFTHLVKDYFKNIPSQIIGMDISAVAIERAAAKFPGIEFVHSEDIESYARQFKAQNNVVICLETLYYIEPQHRAQIIEQLLDLLEDDGLLVISSLNARAPYLNKEEILQLLKDVEVLQVSSLYLKPVLLVERLGIKSERLLRKMGVKTSLLQKVISALLPVKGVQWLSRVFSKVFNKWSTSHVLVVARKASP